MTGLTGATGVEEALDCVRVTVTVTADEQYGVVAEEDEL